jgi:hypothetical protein
MNDIPIFYQLIASGSTWQGLKENYISPSSSTFFEENILILLWGDFKSLDRSE